MSLDVFLHDQLRDLLEENLSRKALQSWKCVPCPHVYMDITLGGSCCKAFIYERLCQYGFYFSFLWDDCMFNSRSVSYFKVLKPSSRWLWDWHVKRGTVKIIHSCEAKNS